MVVFMLQPPVVDAAVQDVIDAAIGSDCIDFPKNRYVMIPIDTKTTLDKVKKRTNGVGSGFQVPLANLFYLIRFR